MAVMLSISPVEHAAEQFPKQLLRDRAEKEAVFRLRFHISGECFVLRGINARLTQRVYWDEMVQMDVRILSRSPRVAGEGKVKVARSSSIPGLRNSRTSFDLQMRA